MYSKTNIYIYKYFYDIFLTQNGLKGGYLRTLLFNLAWVYAIKKAQENQEGL
jgi:hypothetical protein